MPSRTTLLSALLAASLFPALAQETPPSVPGVDAPALAALGPYAIGVRTLQFVIPQHPDILKLDPATKQAPLADRDLPVEVWYPCTAPSAPSGPIFYEAPAGWKLAPGAAATFRIPGIAHRDATPVSGQVFPLIVISHGYPGSRYFLTYLAENLATKGYVVAAIDHTDSIWAGVKPFSSTLFNRSNDQRFVIEELTRRAADPADFLHAVADASRVGLVGYSMGGYGALATAGAGYRKDSALSRFIPANYLDPLLAGAPEFETRRLPQLKAVVAIAPWGEQPPFEVWDAAGLAGIRIPSLFVDGDQDDVSGFELGVKRAFDRSVNSNRCLLVYENARHNVGGNPAPPEAHGAYSALEGFEEPVWRHERINAINQHFITAFLDLYLKADESKRPYLHPAVEKSNDGAWPLKQGENVGGQFSTGSPADKQTVWKGFQRRWAVGLELQCADAAK